MSYGIALKPAAVKKLVLRGHSYAKHGPADLHLNKAAGEIWASNGYWAVRASRVAALLEDYNLAADEPAVFAIDAKVSRSAKTPLDIEAILADNGAGYAVPGTRVKTAGKDAYVLNDSGGLMEVYQLADGTMAGLLAEETGWLSDAWASPLPAAHRVDKVRVMFRRTTRQGVTRLAAAYIADTTRVIEPHKYGTDPETRGQVSIPEVSEPGESILLAVVSATKYES